MDPFTAISLGVAVVGGGAKIVDGIVNAKAARKKLQELENAALPLNAFEALQVNTEQQDIMREELQRISMGQTEMLQQAGTRAIIGGVGTLNEQLRQGFRQIAADVGNKIDERNLLIAEEDANIARVGEARLQGQIKRAGEQLAASKAQTFQGLADIGSAFGAVGAMRQEQSAQDTGNPQANRIANRGKRQTRRGNIAKGIGGEKTSLAGNFLRKATGGTVDGATSKIGRLLSSPFRLIGGLFKRRG